MYGVDVTNNDHLSMYCTQIPFFEFEKSSISYLKIKKINEIIYWINYNSISSVVMHLLKMNNMLCFFYFNFNAYPMPIHANTVQTSIYFIGFNSAYFLVNQRYSYLEKENVYLIEMKWRYLIPKQLCFDMFNAWEIRCWDFWVQWAGWFSFHIAKWSNF